MMLSILSCVCWQSVYLLWKNVYLGLLTILGLGCLFFWYWAAWAACKFWRLINPLSVASFENIFSHSEGCLFILFMASFAVQKLLSFIRSHLFIFGFISISLGGGSKRILLWYMSWSVLPMFSSKSFIISGLTFRSLIHFEFIFMYGVREHSNFILLHVAVQFSQQHLLKRLSFLHCIFLPPLSKIRWPYVCGFISGLSILFHWSIFLFLCQYHTVLITVANWSFNEVLLQSNSSPFSCQYSCLILYF